VYDNAVVLVGNYTDTIMPNACNNCHTWKNNKNTPFTLLSANDNQDDENQSQGKNDQEREQNQGQDDQKQQQPPQDEAKISPQQAQQMLKAIQAREKETSDRVQKEKAALQKSRQKDKNW
ncbi:MAG: hypothetical protein IIT69_03225, partial [Bacteroidales bacterium]|nr:hypothetical protein [Bacteroidales bacterium]